ncbi:hypothetical protein PR048_027891 [Dryococelus australis]|uniref:Uncharacterized protein n=1 Tax=Dryococelus australis TaxID=614101 RepID=A0ABQ9GHS2_9NEOP|nr:hypothetical protein PR048_027891 [Dryococelus australis]
MLECEVTSLGTERRSPWRGPGEPNALRITEDMFNANAFVRGPTQLRMRFPTHHPRENPPANGIVRHDSHLIRPGIEPGSPWWEASVLIAQPPRPQWRWKREIPEKTCRLAVSSGTMSYVRLKQDPNKEAEDTGYTRENPWHDSHIRKSGSDPDGNRARIQLDHSSRRHAQTHTPCPSSTPRWLASSSPLPILPILFWHGKLGERLPCLRFYLRAEPPARRCQIFSSPCRYGCSSHFFRPYPTPRHWLGYCLAVDISRVPGPRCLSGFTARLPPRRAGFNARPSHSRFSASGNRARRWRLSGGFSRGSPVYLRPCTPALLHSHLTPSSSALENSTFGAAQTSQLNSCPRHESGGAPRVTYRHDSVAPSAPALSGLKTCNIPPARRPP